MSCRYRLLAQSDAVQQSCIAYLAEFGTADLQPFGPAASSQLLNQDFGQHDPEDLTFGVDR